jgi:hypothetical protein
VFRRLKLLNYLRKIHLSPEETLPLIRRLETDTCRPEDYEVLIRIVRAHIALSADFPQAVSVDEPPALRPRGKRSHQGVKRTRRRHRGSSHRGIDMACAMRYHLISK